MLRPHAGRGNIGKGAGKPQGAGRGRGRVKPLITPLPDTDFQSQITKTVCLYNRFDLKYLHVIFNQNNMFLWKLIKSIVQNRTTMTVL